MQQHDTIIIGGGISGLACARRLHEAGKEFLLITEDMGGRILAADNGKFNYGAFFVCSDYNHVRKHVHVIKRIRLRDLNLHRRKNHYSLFEKKTLPYLGQFLKTALYLYKFRKKFRKFRKKAEHQSQKKIIENDPVLKKLYMMPANELIKELGIQKVTSEYFAEALYSMTFSHPSEMNAFCYSQYLLPLITPFYTFMFDKEKMVSAFKDKICIATMNGIKKDDKKHIVQTNRGEFTAKNVVFAMPIVRSKKYLGITETNKPISTHMFHVRGEPRKAEAYGEYQLFDIKANVQAMAHFDGDEYMIYYAKKDIPLDHYFSHYELIKHHHWNPAGTINGHVLLEADRGDGIYLASDHNVCGMEDAYITGLFAANKIIERGNEARQPISPQ